MSDSTSQYPKRLATLEKITETSSDVTEVVTVVDDEYEEAAVNVALEFMIEFNRKNAAGCDDLLNFPHCRIGLANPKLTVFEKPPHLAPGFFDRFVNDYGWNHSCWDYRRVVQSCESKVHLAIQFTRYRADGSKIGAFPSLWIITEQDDHWGIKMRSSFA